MPWPWRSALRLDPASRVGLCHISAHPRQHPQLDAFIVSPPHSLSQASSRTKILASVDPALRDRTVRSTASTGAVRPASSAPPAASLPPAAPPSAPPAPRAPTQRPPVPGGPWAERPVCLVFLNWPVGKPQLSTCKNAECDITGRPPCEVVATTGPRHCSHSGILVGPSAIPRYLTLLSVPTCAIGAGQHTQSSLAPAARHPGKGRGQPSLAVLDQVYPLPG